MDEILKKKILMSCFDYVSNRCGRVKLTKEIG